MNTQQIVSPYLGIFERPLEDDSIESFEYFEYLPRDSSNMNKSGDHIIDVNDENIYQLPHKAYLEVRGKLVKTDGSDYAATDNIALTNNGWSLFQSLKYHINNKLVEEISQYLPQASTIMNLVLFSDDYSRSSATNMMWYRDTAKGEAKTNEFTKGSELIAVGTVGDANALNGGPFRTGLDLFARKADYNMGFKIRQTLAAGSKQFTMLLPLSGVLGSHRDINTVMFGVRHSYILTRATVGNYIHRADAAADGRFVINHLSLWMPRVEPKLSIKVGLEEKLVSGDKQQLHFEQLRIYRQQFGSAVTKTTWKVASYPNGELPRHIFIAFASVERDDDQEQNNQVFDNANLTRLFARINSKQYPEQILETDFSTASRNYTRAYMMFQEAMHKYSDTDSGSQVSVEDFASLYPIFHIDVSKHKDELKLGHAEVTLGWTLSESFKKLAGGGASDYHVYCLVQNDRYLTVEAMTGKMNIIV